MERNYRGKRLDNGQWVYGDLIRMPKDLGSCSEPPSAEMDTHIADISKITREWSLVDPKTVGQFTGIQYRKGIEFINIYEGDIVKCWDKAAEDETWGFDKKHIGIIEFASPGFSLKIPGKLDYDGGAIKHWENDVYLGHWTNAEHTQVIGNIYENPEMIK